MPERLDPLDYPGKPSLDYITCSGTGFGPSPENQRPSLQHLGN